MTLANVYIKEERLRSFYDCLLKRGNLFFFTIFFFGELSTFLLLFVFNSFI